jgi:hypothetical protein
MINPTPPSASWAIKSINWTVQLPSSVAIPSQVAERTKRFFSVIEFMVVCSKSADMVAPFLKDIGQIGEIFNRLPRFYLGPVLIIKDLKPESIYFTEQGGTRGAVAIVDINDSSQIPSFSGPFFVNFNANCEFRIAMSPEDLAKSGLDEMVKKWTS